MSTQEVFVQQFERLFHHYRAALAPEVAQDSALWNSVPADDRRRLVEAARLAIVELEGDAPTKNDSRRYFATRPAKLNGAAETLDSGDAVALHCEVGRRSTLFLVRAEESRSIERRIDLVVHNLPVSRQRSCRNKRRVYSIGMDAREVLTMIVMKFGGTSVEDVQAIKRLVTIVRERLREQPVVVSSAMAGVTDTLLQATTTASSGNEPLTLELLEHLEARHIAAAHDLVQDCSQTQPTIYGLFAELRPLLVAICGRRKVSPRLSDRIASFGERLSTVLVSAALVDSGIAATLIDARECILTDDHFTCATPLMDTSNDRVRARLIPLLDAKRVPVLGGFIGATVGGQTTTLGRGGSDLTAALVGGALEAKRVEIWTDVDGIRSTDPRLYPQARHIESISFHEAAEMAKLGAKVLHPSTLIPVMEKNIPVYLLNARNPLHPGTCVRAESDGITGVKAITVKKGITLVEASSDRSFRPTGLARDICSIMEVNGCIPDIVSVSSTGVTVSVDNKDVVGCLRAELAERVKLKAENSKALVSLVADDVRQVVGLPAQVCSSLDGIEVWLASAGASHRSFSFVVSEKDVPDVVRRLHESLLQDNESLPTVRTEEKFDSGVIT